MSSPTLLIGALALSLGLASCTYDHTAPTAYTGNSGRQAYDQGYTHGSMDRVRGLAHNPHINDPDEVPASFRKEYIWGYTEGFQGDPSRSGGSK